MAGLPVNSDIETINVFTPGFVNAAIKKSKLGGASGPDGLPPRLFRKLADNIAEPLSLRGTWGKLANGASWCLTCYSQIKSSKAEKLFLERR